MIRDYMIAWDEGTVSGSPAVKVGPWPDRTKWSAGLPYTAGYCDTGFSNMSRQDQAQALLNLAAGMMFDGVPPSDILREFAKIKTWREMSVLMPGGRITHAILPNPPYQWGPYNP